eukprot:COSAG02_NODE_2516_length_8621_cov_3.609951_2_plen_286_part_00
MCQTGPKTDPTSILKPGHIYGGQKFPGLVTRQYVPSTVDVRVLYSRAGGSRRDGGVRRGREGIPTRTYVMQGWNRDDAQQRAAWSRSGASEWENGGAAQPSADDDDYLKAARRAQSKRMGTLAIPVPAEDFDSLDFEAAGEEQEDQHQHNEGAIPLPTLEGGEDARGVAMGDTTLDAPPLPQWYPPREPVGCTGEDRREPVRKHPRHPDRRMYDAIDHPTDGDEEQQQQQQQQQQQHHHHHQQNSVRQTVADPRLDCGWGEHENIAPEPEPGVERAGSPPSFADE